MRVENARTKPERTARISVGRIFAVVASDVWRRVWNVCVRLCVCTVRR